MSLENISSTKSAPVVESAIEHQIRTIMLEEGNVDCRCPLIFDGEIHRFSTQDGERNNSNGWYIIYPDQPIAGAYGDWSAGTPHTFCTKSLRSLTLTERNEHNARMKQALTKRDADKKALAMKAKQNANSIWSNSKPTTHYHYLKSKGVQSHGLRQNKNEQLIVPLLDTSDEIHSLQFINKNGSKYFLSDGVIKGHFYPIGEVTKTICICEGYSTAASVFETTGYYSIVAFNANNLETVAKVIRGKYPSSDIIICGDNDQFKSSNVGKESACKAAKTINARLVLPQFKSLESKPTDFNDLHRLEDRTNVKHQIDAAVSVHNYNTGNNITAFDWPDPKPFTPKLKPVDPFDGELVPETLAPYITDVSERMQSPPDFIAVTLIIELSAVIGKKILMQPKKNDSWTVVPNLWGMLIGRPTSMKSPAQNETLEILDKIQSDLRDDYFKEVKEFKAKEKVFDILYKRTEKNAEKMVAEGDIEQAEKEIFSIEEKRPKNPELKRYIVNDSSIEKLGELLAVNPNGLLLVRDELSGFLKSISAKDAKNDRPFFLESWSGKSNYTYDRIGRGTIFIESAIISIIGGIQPGVIGAYVDDALAEGGNDDGLIQRFQLMVYPDLNPEWVDIDRIPSEEAKANVENVIMQLHKLEVPEDLHHTPIAKFSNEAQVMFTTWLRDHELRLRRSKFNSAIESHLSKYKSLIPSLSLIFQICDTPNIKEFITNLKVKVRSLSRALAFAEYLESHAMRIYGMETQFHIEVSRLILGKIRDGKLISPFTNKDVWRPQWSGLTDSRRTSKCLGYLVNEGYLREISVQSSIRGGAVKTQYYIHPSIQKFLDNG